MNPTHVMGATKCAGANSQALKDVNLEVGSGTQGGVDASALELGCRRGIQGATHAFRTPQQVFAQVLNLAHQPSTQIH